MLKILYASLRPYYPLRIAHGGQRTLHELMTAAKNLGGVACAALCYSELENLPPRDQWTALGINRVDESKDQLEIDCGYPIHVVFESGGREHYWRRFDQVCREFKPDIIMTGQRYAFEIVHRAREMNLPVIWNIDTSPGQCGIYDVADLVQATRLGVVTICCSQYVRRQIEALTQIQVKPLVIYPPMDRERYRLQTHHPKYLTVINPVEVKGGNLLDHIVESLPGEEFMFVIGWEYHHSDDYWTRFVPKMQRHKNVNIVPRQADIREVFTQTKLLLVPSQWDEALGRVVWEAQCGGIPSIVSATGGLPEVLGDGGELVLNFTDPAAWVSVIQRVLDEPDGLKKLYLAAQKSNCRSIFDPEVNASILLETSKMAIHNSKFSSNLNPTANER